ncbi:hypothetical protein DMC30DRAFT_7609 [Rhodotorula diobovata]|uniref:Uncharacterized protein n=1 Tax=Rhodotorula diobovata TaxID=5288 RepID=A0A5C5G6U8_9BASI|nr:hypothetical protein DMC30DRAFT_7609 [Rhodotorula diobovata]
MIRSSASSASRAVHAHAARTVSCIHVHAAPPAVYPTAPSPPHQPLRRTFTSSPTSRKRDNPVKLLPEWSWRRAWRGYPVPVVEVVNNADDADAVLETLTSSRLSIDPEPGIGQGVTLAQKHRGVSGSSSVKDGVLSVADGEGVVSESLPSSFNVESRVLTMRDSRQCCTSRSWIASLPSCDESSRTTPSRSRSSARAGGYTRSSTTKLTTAASPTTSPTCGTLQSGAGRRWPTRRPAQRRTTAL